MRGWEAEGGGKEGEVRREITAALLLNNGKVEKPRGDEAVILYITNQPTVTIMFRPCHLGHAAYRRAFCGVEFIFVACSRVSKALFTAVCLLTKRPEPCSDRIHMG